jgi:hypothetical protein
MLDVVEAVTLVGKLYARTVTAADPVTRNGPCSSVGLIVRAYTKYEPSGNVP